MARRRHTPEQIIRKLREADRLLNEGADVAAVCRHLRGVRADLSPLAQPVRRHEGRRRQATEGAREGERTAQADRGRQGAREPRPAGDRLGKMVSPSQRRRAAHMLQERLGFSQRRACQIVGQHRSTQRHRPEQRRPRSGPAGRAAGLRPASPTLGLSPGPRRARSGGPRAQPQESPASVA